MSRTADQRHAGKKALKRLRRAQKNFAAHRDDGLAPLIELVEAEKAVAKAFPL